MSTPSIEDVLRESLRHHLYDGCTNPACDPLSDPEACVGRPFLNHRIAEAADSIRAHLAEHADEKRLEIAAAQMAAAASALETVKEYAEAERERANDSEAALLRVAGLADEWDATADRCRDRDTIECSTCVGRRAAARGLRAALAGGASGAAEGQGDRPAEAARNRPRNSEQAEVAPESTRTEVRPANRLCGVCLTCDPPNGFMSRMYVCATCGNKRCPAASDCRKWECSGSNAPSQVPVERKGDQ